jgi:hypothetical protein
MRLTASAQALEAPACGAGVVDDLGAAAAQEPGGGLERGDLGAAAEGLEEVEGGEEGGDVAGSTEGHGGAERLFEFVGGGELVVEDADVGDGDVLTKWAGGAPGSGGQSNPSRQGLIGPGGGASSGRGILGTELWDVAWLGEKKLDRLVHRRVRVSVPVRRARPPQACFTGAEQGAGHGAMGLAYRPWRLRLAGGRSGRRRTVGDDRGRHPPPVGRCPSSMRRGRARS